MENLNLFNAIIGKTLTDVNTEVDAAEEVDKIMNLTIDEFPAYIEGLIKVLPKGIRNLKVSTLLDIIVNVADEETIAELDKLCGET